ncbi:hypothetical protein ACWDBF_21435 [Streptomyces angustmyceticus]
MKRTFTLIVAAISALALGGCSSNSAPKPTPASTTTLHAASYLYRLDGDTHSRRDIDELLQRVGRHCSDDLGVLSSAATVTAVDATDATRRTTYEVLAAIAAARERAGGKANCQRQLKAIGRAIRNSRQ